MAIAFAMIMFGEDADLSVAGIQNEIATRWPGLPLASEIEITPETIAFNIASIGIVMGKMPGPIPWSDLEGPCATSVFWPNAAAEVRKHLIHWVVTVSAELNPVQLAMVLTQVTAAILAASPSALGVYWGQAQLVIPKGIFIDSAINESPGDLPVHLWVHFRLGPDTTAASSGFTIGMAALGHKEIEAPHSTESLGGLHARLVSMVEYLLENGPVIIDGNTVGNDPNERIRVVFSDSAFGYIGKVMRLEYEQAVPKRAWWKPW